MKTKSRMRVPMAGRTCLLFVLCILAGCWDSHTKQDASDQPAAHGSSATTLSDQPSQKASQANPAKTPAGSNVDDQLGFKHTLGPGATPPKSSGAASRVASNDVIAPRPTASAKPSAAAPAITARPPADDDRYADLALAPAVGNSLQGTKTSAGTPQTSETLSPSNPLRDPNADTVARRPEAPPQPAPPSDPIIVPPQNLPAATNSPQPTEKAESILQIKPEATTPAQSPGAAPSAASPVAPTTEKKSEPKVQAAGSVKPGPRTNKNSGVPFDPIAVNGALFEDWPKTAPKLALVITGQQEGYLEPCGCAGLDRMKGGMSRRYTLFRQLREKGWPVVGLDAGGAANGFGKQAELKFQIAVNAMTEMRYSAVALGLSDLRLPTAEVMALTMPANADNTTMFVCLNVGLFDFNEKLLPRTQLIKTGYKTLGVTAVLGKTFMQQLAGNKDLKFSKDPEELLNSAVPLLKKSGADYLILLAHTTREEAIELGKKHPDFNLVIWGGGGPDVRAEPPKNYEEINKGGTKLIEVGIKGEYAVVLGMFDDPQQPLRYQRVALDSRFRGSPQMFALMNAYQGQLKELGLGGLGIHALPNPLKETNGDYVGSEACQNCHEESYRVWKKTPHSHAFATLQNAPPPRNYDPECIACHAVGWNTVTNFFPYQSGYLSEKETPKLINVGCENCHGPGEVHIRAENHGTKAEQAIARKAVRVTKEEMADPNSRKQNCWMCHDLDNSPEFKFDLYWPFVKHYEHDHD
jgi:hypothetical protein